MVIDIKDKQGQIRVSVPVQTGAKGVFTLMSADYIQLPFSSEKVIPFKLGDYADLSEIEYEGLGGKIAKVYEIVDMNNVNPTYNEETGAYDYTLRLDAYYWKWKNKIFKYTPENVGREASWSLTAPLDVQMGVFIRNLNALGYTYRGSNFTFSIDSSVENKALLMSYDNTNLLDALFSMAGEDKWNCDCWITDNVIHFGRNEFGDAVKIERGVEASNITRSESKGTYATRIYAFGSTKNIPENYRPTDEQAVINGVVQKRLMLPADTPFIDAYDGMSEEEAIEDIVVFDDVYPRQIGTLSDVHTRSEEVENEDGSKETVTYYRYKDEDLEFKEEYIIKGKELKIQFRSGKLNGLEFGVIFNPEPKDEIRGSQLWEIVRNEDYGRPLPDDIMAPANGDQYILSGFNIQLVSDLFIPNAEQELKEKALIYAEKVKKDDGTYPTTLRSSWVKEDLISRTFEFGQRIMLVDDTFFSNGRLSRVLGWEFYLDIPWDSPVYTIGESTPYSRISEIEDKVDSLTYKGQTYVGSGGGSSVYVIRTNDMTAPSDSNVFSALRSLKTLLRKDAQDSSNFLLRLLAGAHFFNFTQGMVGGAGAAFYKNEVGKVFMEADSAYLRDELIVPKITFNCIDVISGDKANTFAFGTIKSVDTENFIAELDLLEGQIGTLHVEDICRGVFHNIIGGNNTGDIQDSNGFYSYAGFSTSYFTPLEILENTPGVMKFKYALQPDTSVHPMKGMNFFAYGNFSDIARQSITYETRYYTRRLKNVNTWVIDPTKHISMQDGLLDGLSIGGFVMKGYGTFQENSYFTGVNIQFTPEQEEALKGESAYNVSLSEYNGVVSLKANNTLGSGFTEVLDVFSGDSDVVSNDSNVVASSFLLKTRIQAWKGSKELFFSESYAEGGFTVIVEPHGCEYQINDGVVLITNITDFIKPYLDIRVSCEGVVEFIQTYTITFVQDGKDPAILDLENEMINVIVDNDGNILSDFPLSTKAHIFIGNEEIEISELIIDSFPGVTTSTSGNAIIISEISKDAPTNFSLNITARYYFDDILYEKTTSLSILKVTGGVDAVVYNLLPSSNVIKIDKNGDYLISRINCKVKKTTGTNTEVLQSLPDNLKIKYGIDASFEDRDYPYAEWIEVSTIKGFIYFSLYLDDVLIDNEKIYSIKDGADGQDGSQGSQGLDGLSIRTSEWAVGVQYRNDSDVKTGVRYLDISMVRDLSYSSGWRAFECKKTHVSSLSITYENPEFWSEFSENVGSIFTSFLLAKNAKITFLSGNEILIQNDSGEITCGLSGSEEGGKIRFWAGSQTPDSAPCKINNLGEIFASKGIFSGSIYTPFTFVNEDVLPGVTTKGANGVYVVSALQQTIIMGSLDKEIKEVNGLRFSLLVRPRALDSGVTWEDNRFELAFSKTAGDSTWPSCFVINGVTTQGNLFGVKKSCIIELMYIPKVLSSNKIHKIADLAVLNYDPSYMSYTNWDNSVFSVTPPDSDIIEL